MSAISPKLLLIIMNKDEWWLAVESETRISSYLGLVSSDK